MNVIEFDHGVLRSTSMQDTKLVLHFGNRRIDMITLSEWGREFGDLFFRDDDKDDVWVRFSDSAEATKVFNAIMESIKDGDRFIQFNRELADGAVATIFRFNDKEVVNEYEKQHDVVTCDGS